MQLSQKKHTGRSPFGLCLSQLLRCFVEQDDALVPQPFSGLALGFLPGRDRFLDESLSPGRQAERLGAGVLVRHDLQSAVRLQRFDIAAHHADESRFRREQHLATALCRFRDRFRDLVETVGGGDRGRDRAGGDQRRQMIEHRGDLIRLG